MTAILERLIGEVPGGEIEPEDQIKYEKPATPESLFPKALRVWEVLQPDREPHLFRSAGFEFVLPKGEKPQIKTKGIEVVDGVLRDYVNPQISPEEQTFLAVLSVNPDYKRYRGIESEGKMEAPTSFKLAFWAPIPHFEPQRFQRQDPLPLNRFPILTIRERPASIHGPEGPAGTHYNYRMTILGENPLKRNGNEGTNFELAGLDSDGKPEWKKILLFLQNVAKDYFCRAYYAQGDMEVKRGLVAEILGSLATMDTDIPKEVSDYLRARMEERKRGELEFASIGSDIAYRDPITF